MPTSQVLSQLRLAHQATRDELFPTAYGHHLQAITYQLDDLGDMLAKINTSIGVCAQSLGLLAELRKAANADALKV